MANPRWELPPHSLTHILSQVSGHVGLNMQLPASSFRRQTITSSHRPNTSSHNDKSTFLTTNCAIQTMQLPASSDSLASCRRSCSETNNHIVTSSKHKFTNSILVTTFRSSYQPIKQAQCHRTKRNKNTHSQA